MGEGFVLDSVFGKVAVHASGLLVHMRIAERISSVDDERTVAYTLAHVTKPIDELSRSNLRVLVGNLLDRNRYGSRGIMRLGRA